MGHVRAADALLAHLKSTHPEIETTHIDLMDFLAPLAKNFYFDSYNFMAKRVPKLWGTIYRATNNPKGAKHFNQLTKINKKIGAKKFFKFIEKYQPDYILSTHFTPADLIANHAHSYNITTNNGLLITDFAAHPLHLASDQTDYFVPTQSVKNQLVNFGANVKQVVVSGLPLNPAFYQTKSAQNLKNRYHLNDNKTLLFLAGGGGFTKIDRLLKNLFEQKLSYNIIAIAGKNKQLYNRLTRLIPPADMNFVLTEWTDAIDEFMRVADLIITKSGGLTIAECLYLQKPMLIIDPVPGQEEDNLKFLEDNHYGQKLKTATNCSIITENILTPQKIIYPPPLNANDAIINNILKNLA